MTAGYGKAQLIKGTGRLHGKGAPGVLTGCHICCFGVVFQRVSTLTISAGIRYVCILGI